MLLREWTMQGLPNDSVSQENALFAVHGYRWPLLIDPQLQANRWLRNTERQFGIEVLRFSHPKFVFILNKAISNGSPVLVEDVDSATDPVLDSVLAKSVYNTPDGRRLIRFADKDIDYHKDFRLYLTTKLPNPAYLVLIIFCLFFGDERE